MPFKESDLSNIGSFFKELYPGFDGYGSMGYFHWKIVANYLHPGKINLVKDNNRIASTTSITPKSLIFKNSDVAAAEIGDTYTHPDYWRQGMFSLLINQSRKDAEDSDVKFIYGTPNKLSLPGYQKKANFDIIKNLNVKSLVFPINIEHKIIKKSHWIFGRIIGYLSTLIFFLIFKIKTQFFYDRNISIKEISEIPDDWGEFWLKASKSFDFIINRNKDAIKWRYFENPNKYHIIKLSKKKLIGYMVYRINFNESLNRVKIADYLTLPGEEKALKVGLKHILDKAFKTGANQVDLWGVNGSAFSKIFREIGFLIRGDIPVICYKNSFSEKVDNCNSWHFTIGDSDNI